jgi:pimeloyl-ACP methyl ester carboxylesterase
VARSEGRATQKASGLEYESSGDGEAILTIHGAIVADSFGRIIDEPALRGYRVIRYRRRGYGASDPPSSPPSIEEHARDARSLLQQLSVTRAHVVGHSGGGPIAVQLAISAPEVVHSLILLEPALQTAAMAAAFDELIAPLVEMHRAGSCSKAVHLWMRATGGSDWRTEIERLLPGASAQADRDAAGTFDGDLTAMRSWDFDAVGAPGIGQPVLYVLGSHNAENLEPVTSMFRAAVPHTEVVVVAEADHNLQITKATPVARAIAEFLGRHPI